MFKSTLVFGVILMAGSIALGQENIGTLSNLYLSEIEPIEETDEFIILKDSDEYNASDAKAKSKEKRKLQWDRWSKVTDVSIYGGGSLFGLVTGDTTIEENTSPSGSLGINFSTQRITGSLFYSFNGRQTVELTTLSQFGNALMNPNLSGQSLTFSTTGIITPFLSANFSLKIADNLWQFQDLTPVDASPIVSKLGFYFSPFEFNQNELSNNRIKLLFGAHRVWRKILGDFRNQDYSLADVDLSNSGYDGFDLSINAVLNSVQLYTNVSFNAKDNIPIPGFSGTQVTFGINVTGNLISLTDDEKEEKEK